MAKATRPKNTDVIELEAEEVSLETTIQNELVKHNLTDAVISELKSKYGELRLKSIDDKESYLEVCEARKEVRKWGILTEKITKAGRAKAIEVQKLWLKKESDVLAKIAEVQDPLDAEIKKYEDEVERKENAEAQRREEAYIKRQSQLLKMGASYDNGSFVLNHIAYEANILRDSDDEIWAETILPKYQKEHEKNEAEKVAAEKKREEEALALKQQQEEMERQKKEFETQQAAFREQQEALRKQQDAAAQQERDRLAATAREEQEKLAEERRLKAEKEEKTWRSRLAMIDEVGWNGQYAFPRLGSDETKIFTYDELVHLPDDVFNARLKEANDSTAAKKKEIEEKREADRKEQIRLAEEAAAQRERERIAEVQRQEEIRKNEEAAKKAEDLLKAKDSEKWQLFVATVTGVAIPDMKSPSYKSRVVEAQKLLQKITML